MSRADKHLSYTCILCPVRFSVEKTNHLVQCVFRMLLKVLVIEFSCIFTAFWNPSSDKFMSTCTSVSVSFLFFTFHFFSECLSCEGSETKSSSSWCLYLAVDWAWRRQLQCRLPGALPHWEPLPGLQGIFYTFVPHPQTQKHDSDVLHDTLLYVWIKTEESVSLQGH